MTDSNSGPPCKQNPPPLQNFHVTLEMLCHVLVTTSLTVPTEVQCINKATMCSQTKSRVMLANTNAGLDHCEGSIFSAPHTQALTMSCHNAHIKEQQHQFLVHTLSSRIALPKEWHWLATAWAGSFPKTAPCGIFCKGPITIELFAKRLTNRCRAHSNYNKQKPSCPPCFLFFDTVIHERTSKASCTAPCH